MKTALLSLITAAALLAAADPADARPPRYRGGYSGVRFYPSINTSPYYGNYWGGNYWGGNYWGGYPGYYSGYYPNAIYPASGVSLNFGGFGLSVGNGYVSPYYGGFYNSGFYSPYYGGGYYGNRWWRGW